MKTTKPSLSTFFWSKALLLATFSLPLVGCGTVCGDLVVDAGEVCDDGNLEDRDGCTNECVASFALDCVNPPNLVPNAQLQQCDMSNLDLSSSFDPANLLGADLSQANLTLSRLVFANLTDANLSGALLNLAECGSATFTNATLAGANLSGATLSAANMFQADLQGANLGNAEVTQTNFAGANLTGAAGIPRSIDQAIFSDTICPNGINSDDAGGTCVGQGF